MGGLLTACTLMGGAFATWQFAEGAILSQDISLQFELAPFQWDSSEVLPDNPTAGAAHQQLASTVLTELNKPNSKLNSQISDRQEESKDTYGSMDLVANWQGIQSVETENLDYLLHFPADDESTEENEAETRYLYTTSVDLGGSTGFWESNHNIPEDRYVYVVYRTVLQLENGEWVAQGSARGYAYPGWYQDTSIFGALANTPSIDIATWTAGKQGTSTANSIYAYVGQTVTTDVDSATETAYYDVTPSGNQTLTISTSNANARFSVFVLENGQETSVATQSSSTKDENGSDVFSVSFTAKQNVQYYVRVVGDTSIMFTIS